MNLSAEEVNDDDVESPEASEPSDAEELNSEDDQPEPEDEEDVNDSFVVSDDHEVCH